MVLSNRAGSRLLWAVDKVKRWLWSSSRQGHGELCMHPFQKTNHKKYHSQYTCFIAEAPINIQLKGKGGGIPSKLLTSIGGSSSGAQSHLASLNSHTALIKTHLSSRHRFGSVQRTDFTTGKRVPPSHGLPTVDGHLLAAQWEERLVFVFSAQTRSFFKDM